jgi:predicted transcriptional regulator
MKKNISISFDEELIKKIDKICKVSERKKSWFVEKAVKSYLEEIDDAEVALKRSMDPDTEFINENELKKNLNS